MFNFYNVILASSIIFLIFSQAFAQEIRNIEPTKKDSSDKNGILLKDNYHKNFNGFQLLIPQEYNLQSQYFISDFEYNTTKNFYFTNNNLHNFEKGMRQLLSLGYKDLTKYDLGVIGKYLGISKNILAILLAILSTM